MSVRMSKRRRIRDERAARACLAAIACDGSDLTTWARANGYSARSLNAWRINLERRARTQGRMESSVTSRGLGSSSLFRRIVLRLLLAMCWRGGIRLEVGDDFFL